MAGCSIRVQPIMGFALINAAKRPRIPILRLSHIATSFGGGRARSHPQAVRVHVAVVQQRRRRPGRRAVLAPAHLAAEAGGVEVGRRGRARRVLGATMLILLGRVQLVAHSKRLGARSVGASIGGG